MSNVRKSHFVMLPNDDGSVALHPMKEWLRSNPSHVPEGLDATASTSHQLRAGLKKLGWSMQESNDEFRLLPPGTATSSNPALREMLDVRADGDASEAEEREDASFGLEHQLRDFLAQNLPAIAIGGQRLRVFVDQTGRDGVEYPTAVGFIDILAVDDAGNFHVLELKRGRTPDYTVGQLARYMGWVSQTVGRRKQVFGVVVAKQISESLRYAACVFPGMSLYEYEVIFELKPAAPIAGAAE